MYTTVVCHNYDAFGFYDLKKKKKSNSYCMYTFSVSPKHTSGVCFAMYSKAAQDDYTKDYSIVTCWTSSQYVTL